MSKISDLFKRKKIPVRKSEYPYGRDDYTYTSPEEEMIYNKLAINGLYKCLIHKGIIDGKELVEYINKYRDDYDVHLTFNQNNMKFYTATRNTPKTEDSSNDQAIQTEDNSEGSTEA